jgi:hypothetical protein
MAKGPSTTKASVFSIWLGVSFHMRRDGAAQTVGADVGTEGEAELESGRD